MAISSAMKRHMRQNVTTICSLWKISSIVDGTVLRAANHVRGITYLGKFYRAFPLLPSDLQRRDGLNPDNMELMGILKRGGITEFDIISGRWRGADIEMVTLNYKDTSMGPGRRVVGKVGVITIGDVYFNAEVKSQMSKLGQPVGRIYGRMCDVDEFGDERCDPGGLGNVKATYTHAATITAAPDRGHFTVDLSPAKADHYFAQGQVVFTSGRNNGIKMDIKESIGNVITLFESARLQFQIGDTVNLTFGCNRYQSTCATIINTHNPSGKNSENHRGMAYMPNADDVYNFPA